jgi:hypothetical protein
MKSSLATKSPALGFVLTLLAAFTASCTGPDGEAIGELTIEPGQTLELKANDGRMIEAIPGRVKIDFVSTLIGIMTQKWTYALHATFTDENNVRVGRITLNDMKRLPSTQRRIGTNQYCNVFPLRK